MSLNDGNRTQFVEKDGQGNVTGTTNATYSSDNRLLTYGNSTYTWDQNGNMLSKSTNGVTVSYDCDYENKMVELDNGVTMSFTYNGDGLRQSKTVDSTTTRYVYSGVRLIRELNSNGTTQVSYTLAPIGGQWEPLISHRESSATDWYAFDQLGTTRTLIDSSEGVDDIFTDDAWGNVLNASDSSATAHQYAGRYGYYLDGASGLQLLAQRYYDSAVGRFVSEDPVRYGIHHYQYSGHSPFLRVDPSGLADCCCCCADSVSIGNVRPYHIPPFPNGQVGAGHEFTVTIGLSYYFVPGPRNSGWQGCSLQRWEWVDRPTSVPGAQQQQWQDMYQVYGASPVFDDWKDTKRPRPGRVTIRLKDPPRDVLSPPVVNQTRLLHFRIRVYSGPYCLCPNEYKEVTAIQRVSFQNGLPDWPNTTFDTPGSHLPSAPPGGFGPPGDEGGQY